MTGLQDKRATKESRRSKRLARSRPEAAAPPPARRARRAEAPVPRKREASVPAARVARSPSPPCGERDSEDVTTAPPPARRARRAEALVPLRKREASVPAARAARSPPPPPPPHGQWAGIKVLRNRKVLVPHTGNRKPSPSPPRYEKGKELKRDRTWQTPTCARVGLEHYNIMNQGDEHELVKAVYSSCFIFNGIWMHANFLAKRKGATNCVDLVLKYFFAELTMEGSDLSCVSCVKLDPGYPQKIGGCGVCPQKIMHPAAGGYLGARPRPIQHAASGLQISFSF